MIVYDIGGNKFCDKIGRQHKSNHVQIICYLKEGYYIRQCRDPECKKVSLKESFIHPLPLDLLRSRRQETFQEEWIMEKDFQWIEDEIMIANDSYILEDDLLVDLSEI